MNTRHCTVPNCKSTTKTSSMHQFPRDIQLGEKWLNAVCSPTLRNISYQEIRQKRYAVCGDHFEGNTCIPTVRSKRLKYGAIPTLQLPDSQNWQHIYFNFSKEIDLKNFSPKNISIDNGNKDETKIDNIFAQEFSSSFKYSDSPNFLDIIDFELPIRAREIGDSFEIQPFLKQLERKESGCKDKNSPSVSETLKRPSTDYLESLELLESTSPGLDFVEDNSHDISERIKKPQLDLKNGDIGISEEPAVLEIKRLECSAERTMNISAFEVFQSNDSVKENLSILRNILSSKTETYKDEENKLSVGEAKRAELSRVGGEILNTEKNVKRQKYKTTIKLKRRSNENGKVVEDIFIIEHTFMSTCSKCSNHKNDTVSCKVEKVK